MANKVCHYRPLVLLVCVISSIIALSCASTVWDDSIPLEQSTKIIFYMFEPKGYNGITVEKKKFAFVTIPAGQAEFLGDIVWFTYVGPNIRYNFSAKDAVFSCTLEAGKEYWAVAGYKLNDDNASRTWGIYLYDDKIKARVGFPGDDKLVGFIPFNPQVLSN